METINSLAGPLGQRLTWTLLHFLWQGAVLAGLLESVIYLCGVRSLTIRYRLVLAALLLMAACPIVTFFLVRPNLPVHDLRPRSHALRGNELTAAPRPGDKTWTQSVRAFRSHAERGNEVEPGTPPLAPLPAPVVDPAAPSPPPRVSALARWQPWLLGGWAIGAGLLGLRLLIGGGMAWRMRLARRPLDAEWADRARRLALRLGVRRAAVFVSSRVRQALVAGVWGPMVLLPAAWLAEMPTEMLEGVLAHELAHLRRLDLWAILLQRLVETFLFYHPAVWWLSRRLSREREMCCDEMAVAATGDRLAFTEALQWAAQRPAADRGLVLGAAWKGNQKMVIERIRRLLGADVPRERFSWWPLGLAALVVPALLMFSALSAKEAPPAEKPDDGTPALAEIAKANDAAWAAIRSFDVEFEDTTSLTIHGTTTPELRSSGGRWSKQGLRERFHGSGGGFTVRGLAANDNEKEKSIKVELTSNDDYYDGKNHYFWRWENESPQSVHGAIYEGEAADFISFWLCLRRIMLPDGDSIRCPTLAQLIASGGVTVRGRQKSKDGDTLWVLEVNDPIRDGVDKKNPRVARIYVDADKGFLISRVESRLSRSAAKCRGNEVEDPDVTEIVKFTDCGHGVFFPSTIRWQARMLDDSGEPVSGVRCALTCSATRLSVNAPLPADAFNFRFPEHAVVRHEAGGRMKNEVDIWGPDNRPIKEFKTEKDFLDFQEQEKAKEARRQAAPEHDMNKPAGIPYDASPYVPPYSTGQYIAPPQSSTTADRSQTVAGAAISGVGSNPDAGLVGKVTIDPESIDSAKRKLLDERRAEVERKRDSKEPADLKQRVEYYFETKDYDKALPAFEALIAADPKSQSAVQAHYGCGIILLMRGRDFSKAAAEFSESLRWYEGTNAAQKSKDRDPMDLRPFYFLRGLAYANQADGLDRALADMTTTIETKMPPDPSACYARLFRSAIYLRRNELDKAGSDIAVVLRGDVHFPDDLRVSSLIFVKDAYGILSLILAKHGDDHSKAIVNQQFATLSAVTQRPSTAPDDQFNDVFGGILHRTLLRLLPAMEKLGPNGAPQATVPATASPAPAPVPPPDSRAVNPHLEEAPDQKLFLANFVGNSFVSALRLKTLIDAHAPQSYFPSGNLDNKKLDDDVSKLTAYYRSFGFFHARIGREVEFNEKQNCATVIFVFDEGPRYSVRNVSFLGNRKLDNARLAGKLKLVSGQFFDANQQTLDLQKLRDEYGAEGYVFAKVEADNRLLKEPEKIDIVYNIEEGDRYRISRLNLNRLPVKPADVVDSSEIRKSGGPLKTAQLYNGVGVNSDAGLVGDITLDDGAEPKIVSSARKPAVAAKPAPPAGLPTPAAAAAMVEVKVAVLEVDRAKLRTSDAELQRTGVDLDKLPADLAADRHDAVLAALSRDGMGQVLAAPRIVAAIGNKAFIEVGRMAFDVLPTVVDKDRVRLEWHLRLSPEEGTNAVVANDGFKLAARTLEINSPLDVRLGRTRVVSGGRLQSANAEKQIVLVLTAKHYDGKVSESRRAAGIETAGDVYRVEPPDVIRIEVTRFPGGKTVLAGLYLVGPDGTINLRQYGVPQVAGLSAREVERQIVKAVSRKESGGEYSARAEVTAYNSKVVYVIFETENYVARVPANSASTVASTILQVEGAAAKAAKESVWLARPKRKSDTKTIDTEVKLIDWQAIVEHGKVEANLTLLPGDRIHIGRRPEEHHADAPVRAPERQQPVLPPTPRGYDKPSVQGFDKDDSRR